MEKRKIRFVLKGMSPLKMDRFFDEEVTAKTKEEYKRAAEGKIYKDEHGDLCIPSSALKASMKAAATELVGVRKGKSMRQTIAAQIFMAPNLTIIPKRKKHDGIAEDRVVRKVGKQDTSVVSYRPLIKEWGIEGEMTVIGGVETNFLKNTLELSGLKYALLGHRPEFGRFTVEEFEEVKV